MPLCLQTTLPLKMYPALFVEFPTNAGLCGYYISLTFFNFPHFSSIPYIADGEVPLEIPLPSSVRE